MPLPKPEDGESRHDFIDRCMADKTMVTEYPQSDQRVAVCSQQWRDHKGKETNMRHLEWNREQLRGKEFLEFQNAPETLDGEKRTVDVIWFTGIDVPRRDWWTGERYILRFDPQGADLTLLNNGAPVLDNHSLWEGHSAQKGRVERAWKDNGVYKATLRFSRRKSVDELWQDIEDKIVTKFSMGTEVLEEEELAEKDGQGKKIRVRLARRWRPFEISIAPIPADPGTTTMSGARAGQSLRASAQEGEQPMEPNKTTGIDARETPEAQATPPNPEELKKEAAASERLRIAELGKIGRAAKLDEKLIAAHVDQGTSVEVFRKIALDDLARRSDEHPIRSAVATITRDEADTRREAMTNALLHRFSPSRYKLEEPGRDYVNLSLLEMAKECLERAGIRARPLSKMEVVTMALGAQSTSDFPNLLAAGANKVLMDAYAMEQSRWRDISARRSAPDFKAISELAFDSNARLEKVLEGGEFHRGVFVESKNTWQLATYGKIYAITRQAIINDDLGAFQRGPQLMGQEVAQLEADTVWGVITANAALGDSIALFHASHANLTGTGTAISDTSIGVGRKTMRVQTGPGGRRLNVIPRFLVVPAGKEQLALQYTSTNYVAAQPTNINVYAGTLQVISEPRLDDSSATAWYLFADPAAAPVVIYAYLQGQEGPFTEYRNGFDVDGLEYKVRHDFGAGAVDFRGAYKNNGA